MSIRSFSNQDCPKCNKDTLHRACVCSECGNVKPTPSEQRKRAFMRIGEKYRKIYGPGTAGVIMNKANYGKPPSEKTATAPPGTSRALFGKGRGVPKR